MKLYSELHDFLHAFRCKKLCIVYIYLVYNNIHDINQLCKKDSLRNKNLWLLTIMHHHFYFL
jgi:hypothetical protein